MLHYEYQKDIMLLIKNRPAKGKYRHCVRLSYDAAVNLGRLTIIFIDA